MMIFFFFSQISFYKKREFLLDFKKCKINYFFNKWEDVYVKVGTKRYYLLFTHSWIDCRKSQYCEILVHLNFQVCLFSLKQQAWMGKHKFINF